MFMAGSSRDSLTPLRRPSTPGLMPIFGGAPRKRFTGVFVVRLAISAIMFSLYY
jgi:hypothetical protein